VRLLAVLAAVAAFLAITAQPPAPAAPASAASPPADQAAAPYALAGAGAVVEADGPAAAAAPIPRVTRFRVPIEGGVVPAAPELLPGSARFYRGGFHEGVDFPFAVGTPVYAAATGTVSRIDYAFEDWSEPARNAALDNARRLGYTPELVLDLIRGRQVWIDHGNGVVTRYAHLSAVAPLKRGDPVDETTVIGRVGSSGYPEGGAHLHFEIRIGDSYVGAGLGADGARDAVRKAFGR